MKISPSAVTVRDRQRKEIGDITELKASLAKRQIHPITVRKDGDEIILVTGGRRLAACKELGIDVEVKFWEELSQTEAEIVELEENINRTDLPWRDHVRAFDKIHKQLKATNTTWSVRQTAEYLGRTTEWTHTVLAVALKLDDKILDDAQGIKHAYALLQRHAERRAASVVSAIASAGSGAFSPKPAAPATANLSPTPDQISLAPSPGTATLAPTLALAPPPPPAPDPVVNASFLEWLATYAGPKFNLIHCDFPFGIKFTGGYGQEEDGIKYDSTEEDYWTLVDALCQHTEQISSYSSHLMFWFSMTFYTETCRRLRGAGWKVQDHPLIWYKSDGQGIIPGRNEYPRRVYETALLCSRGSRPLVKMTDNCYACPRPSNSIHPSQKPEPALRHFFGALIDSTTDMLDPTCGSGSALRAAEYVGARSVLGLEINADFAKAANAATLNARLLRKAVS